MKKFKKNYKKKHSSMTQVLTYKVNFDKQKYTLVVRTDRNDQYTAEITVNGNKADDRVVSKLKGRPVKLVDPGEVLYNELERQKLDYERFGEY